MHSQFFYFYKDKIEHERRPITALQRDLTANTFKKSNWIMKHQAAELVA